MKMDDKMKAALLAERKRGMDDAIKAAIDAYNKEDFAALGDMTSWDIRDLMLDGIRAARDKLK
jgi:hypothetical protein